MNAQRELAPGTAPLISGDSPRVQAAAWNLPSFDAQLRASAASTSKASQEIDLEAVQAQAFREGHARGYADGYAQGAAAAAAEAQRLQQLMQHLAAPLAELDGRTEQALLALMLELARRLVQQELSSDPAKMLAMVREAVGHLAQPARDLRLRLHPEDARVLAEHLQVEVSECGWRVIADRQLMPGDCVVESDSARIDARLDTRQAQLAQQLLGDEA